MELSLVMVDVPPPGPNDVVIRVEASPINPSDLGLLLAGADLSTARISGPEDDPVWWQLSACDCKGAVGPGGAVPSGRQRGGRHRCRFGFGRVGAGPGRQDRGCCAAGAMYSGYRTVDASLCLELPDGISAPRVRPASSTPSPPSGWWRP